MGALLAGGLGACVDGGDALSAGFLDDGPRGPAVVFDPLARPVPEVPLPNDLLLTPDDHNGAGHAWNITEAAPTAIERRLRRMLNRLDGFGTLAPVAVQFDGPIALATVSDHSVLLVNVEPGHPREGEVVPLELDRGYQPIGLDRQVSFWPHDARKALPDYLYGEANTVDLDGDGVMERPSHYEVETHTLILRPLVPLAEGARHAVLITRAVLGDAIDGAGQRTLGSVRSPFPAKVHAAQVEPVARALALTGLSAADLAFGWTYTTAQVTRPLRVMRAGVHGQGALAKLAEVAPVITEIRNTDITHDADGVTYEADPHDNVFILQPGIINAILGFISEAAPELQAQLTYVDYMLFGSFASPNVRTGENLSVGVDPDTGAGEVTVGDVPFFIGVPKTTERHQPPFPVVIYFHGTSSSRLELLGILDALARQGIAGVAFDQVAHGPILGDIPSVLAQEGLDPALVELIAPVLAEILVPDRVDEFLGLPAPEAIEKLTQIGLFGEFSVVGRAEDYDGDGLALSGENFFSADPFRQCAAFEQDMVDLFQLVKLLRGFSAAAVPPAVDSPTTAPVARLMDNLLAGDFNADGILDLGGPNVAMGIAGTSLGGFHAILGGALEPEITTATPLATGGGITDIILRSKLRNVTRTIFLELFGPVVVGCPDGDGGLWLSLNDDSDGCDKARLSLTSVAHVPGAGGGGRVTVGNLSNGESKSVEYGPQGGFSLAVESDRWDQLAVRVEAADGGDHRVLVQTPYEGLGFDRNSPELRRFLNIGAHVLDRCDPATFAPHLFLDPFEGNPPTNLLLDVAVGDWTVPVSSALTVARAAGALGSREVWQPLMEALRDSGLLDGSDAADVDDILGDNPPGVPALGPLVPVQTATGLSTIRFADVAGHHEWIASVDQSLPLDHATLSQSRLALFHWSGGTLVSDDPCIARLDCPLLDDPRPLLPK